MSDISRNEKPQIGGVGQAPPGAMNPLIDSQIGAESSETGKSLPEHASPRLSHRAPAPPPRLIRDSGMWVWLWVIGAVMLIAITIVAGMALR
jgi:hypothetical protein